MGITSLWEDLEAKLLTPGQLLPSVKEWRKVKFIKDWVKPLCSAVYSVQCTLATSRGWTYPKTFFRFRKLAI